MERHAHAVCVCAHTRRRVVGDDSDASPHAPPLLQEAERLMKRPVTVVPPEGFSRGSWRRRMCPLTPHGSGVDRVRACRA